MFETLPVFYNAFCLAFENKLEVLRCMASLNIYDEGAALQQSQSVCEAVASISVLTADVASQLRCWEKATGVQCNRQTDESPDVLLGSGSL